METIRQFFYCLVMCIAAASPAMGEPLPCEWRQGNLVITASRAGYGMPLCEIAFDRTRVRAVRGYLQGDRYGAWERARIFSQLLGIGGIETTGYAMPFFDREAAVVLEMSQESGMSK